MAYTKYSAQDVAREGEALYERSIRRTVQTGNEGKFVVIDIESGDFQLDDDDLRATQRLLAKRPNAVIYGLRIGYPAAYTLGTHAEAESR